MFHQVQVLPADRDALKFLWRFLRNSPTGTYKMNVNLYGKENKFPLLPELGVQKNGIRWRALIQ